MAKKKTFWLSDEAIAALPSLAQSLSLRSAVKVSENAALNIAIIELDKIEKAKRPAQPRGVINAK